MAGEARPGAGFGWWGAGGRQHRARSSFAAAQLALVWEHGRCPCALPYLLASQTVLPLHSPTPVPRLSAVPRPPPQVKNFGRRGRTKWTHLVAEDTTSFESPWAQNDAIRAKVSAHSAAGNRSWEGLVFGSVLAVTRAKSRAPVLRRPLAVREEDGGVRAGLHQTQAPQDLRDWVAAGQRVDLPPWCSRRSARKRGQLALVWGIDGCYRVCIFSADGSFTCWGASAVAREIASAAYVRAWVST